MGPAGRGGQSTRGVVPLPGPTESVVALRRRGRALHQLGGEPDSPRPAPGFAVPVPPAAPWKEAQSLPQVAACRRNSYQPLQLGGQSFQAFMEVIPHGALITAEVLSNLGKQPALEN